MMSNDKRRDTYMPISCAYECLVRSYIPVAQAQGAGLGTNSKHVLAVIGATCHPRVQMESQKSDLSNQRVDRCPHKIQSAPYSGRGMKCAIHTVSFLRPFIGPALFCIGQRPPVHTHLLDNESYEKHLISASK